MEQVSDLRVRVEIMGARQHVETWGNLSQFLLSSIPVSPPAPVDHIPPRARMGTPSLSRLSGRFHPQFLDENRRDIGKSQSRWAAYTMETPPGSLSPGVPGPNRLLCPLAERAQL
eukprot:COSAG01_NODE_3559_length_5935_cov_2.330535_7_plen_115_part_00